MKRKEYDKQTLESIISFKRIVLNYLKMQKIAKEMK
jgi:hypothetical protein